MAPPTSPPMPAVTDALHAQARRLVPLRGTGFAARAFSAGLAVTRSDGRRVPIPVAALPIVVDDEEIDRRRLLALRLAAATAKAARYRLAHDRAALLAALTPIERRLLTTVADRPCALATARVDFLADREGRLHALEVNATIPAMQGYSDLAVRCWLDAFLDDDRSVSAALAAANGSNIRALLDALLALHARERGKAPDRIGLLARRNDAQETELVALRDGWRAAGFDAAIVFPDQLTFRAGVLASDGVPLSLVYRHLFLHRLQSDPCPALVAALLHRGRGTLVLNGPAPHLELKSTLALLSRSARDDDLAARIGVDDDERRAIASALPLTRRLHELDRDELTLAEVIASPSDWVLKRDRGHGGES
jgi:hypothetical protein